MLDIGWGELLVIGLVALIVVGPKDLPGLFRTAGQFMGKARGMAREFQRSMEAAADESGLKEVSNSLKGIERLNLNSATSSARKYAEMLAKGGDAAAPPKTPQPSTTPTAAATPQPSTEPRSPPATPPVATTVASASSQSTVSAAPAPADAPPPARDAAP